MVYYPSFANNDPGFYFLHLKSHSLRTDLRVQLPRSQDCPHHAGKISMGLSMRALPARLNGRSLGLRQAACWEIRGRGLMLISSF